MTQALSSVQITNDKNLNAKEGLDSKDKEAIINALVNQGLPSAFNPNNYINKIAENYGISTQEARQCLKEAVDNLEFVAKAKGQKEKEEQDNEKLYAQSGYFYPSQTLKPINKSEKQDGMDSLVDFASFQKLKFGLY